MTINYGYPPSSLPSRSSQSAPFKPIGYEPGAMPSPSRFTTAQIVALNAGIVAGTTNFPTGSEIQNSETDQIYVLQGLGVARAFAPLGGSVQVAPARVANFNILSSDNGLVIPISVSLTATLLAASALDVNFMCELRNVAGSVTTTLSAGAGATLIVGGASVGSASITLEGSSIVVLGSGTANRFYASKVGT